MALDVPALAGAIVLPDEAARRQAQELADAAHGALGRLGQYAVWLAAAQGRCPPVPPTRARLIVVEGDDAAGDLGMPASLAEDSDVGVRVVDGLKPGAASDAFVHGSGIADAEVDGGTDLFLVAGRGAIVPTAAVIALLAGAEVATVVGHRPGVDDREWMRRCAAVRDTARAGRAAMGELAEILAATQAISVAALAGVVTQAVIRRTPVLLDDTAAAAAALVTQRISYRATRWMTAAHRTGDPGQAVALERLRLTPMLNYELDVTAPVGGLLALPHLRAAVGLLVGEPPL